MNEVKIRDKLKYYNMIKTDDVRKHEDKEQNSTGVNKFFSSISNALFRYFKYFIVFFFCYYTIQECQNGSIKNDLLAKIIINLLSGIIFITVVLALKKYSSSEYFKIETFLLLLGVKEDSSIYQNISNNSVGGDADNYLNEYKKALNKKCYKELSDEINSYLNFIPSKMNNYLKFWFSWRAEKWNNLIKDILLSVNQEQAIRCLVRNKNDTWSSAIYKDGKITQDDIYNQGTVDVNTIGNINIGKNTDNIIWPFGGNNLYELSSLKNFIKEDRHSSDNYTVESNVVLNDILRKAIYATKIQSRFNGHKSLRCENFESYKELFEVGSSVQTRYNQDVVSEDPSCKELEIQADTGFFGTMGQNIGSTFGNIGKNIGSTFDNIGKNIGSTFGNIGKNIGSTVENISNNQIDKMVEPLISKMNTMLEKKSNPEELSKELSKEISKKITTPMRVFLKTVDSGLYNKLTSGKKEDLTEGLKLVNNKLDLLPPNSVVSESGKKMISTALNKLK